MDISILYYYFMRQNVLKITNKKVILNSVDWQTDGSNQQKSWSKGFEICFWSHQRTAKKFDDS